MTKSWTIDAHVIDCSARLEAAGTYWEPHMGRTGMTAPRSGKNLGSNSLGKSLIVGVGAVLLLCSAAMAQEREPARAPAAVMAPGVRAPAAVVADAPNARLAALIRPPGVLVLNKGVDKVTSPANGIYCILPTAASGINPTTAVPNVSVDFFYSKFNEVTVQTAHGGSPCGKARIAVYTFADVNLTGRYSFSNQVGFNITVP
jgi:hypothetical protein